MDVIFAKIILEKEEGRIITRRDLINYGYDGYDCEIFVNEVRFVDSMRKDNHIVYIFKQKYNNLEYMFYDCKFQLIYLIIILIM